jgi:hypothetical protein
MATTFNNMPDNDYPPSGTSWDEICNTIPQFIVTLGNATFNSDRSIIDAWNITSNCTDYEELFELWDDIRDLIGDRRFEI